MQKRIFSLSLALLAALTGYALADVDLVTIPRREATQLTIYNSEDITMVREHRLLTVKQGINRIQFSWANTLIDPTSIDFRILDHVDKVDLVDTTFPAERIAYMIEDSGAAVILTLDRLRAGLPETGACVITIDADGRETDERDKGEKAFVGTLANPSDAAAAGTRLGRHEVNSNEDGEAQDQKNHAPNSLFLACRMRRAGEQVGPALAR